MYQVSYNSRRVSVWVTPSSRESVLEHFETTEENQPVSRKTGFLQWFQSVLIQFPLKMV
jgi:antibiotic biosynthesis monooxygenase (ABM) superfamily enzyme